MPLYTFRIVPTSNLRAPCEEILLPLRRCHAVLPSPTQPLPPSSLSASLFPEIKPPLI